MSKKGWSLLLQKTYGSILEAIEIEREIDESGESFYDSPQSEELHKVMYTALENLETFIETLTEVTYGWEEYLDATLINILG